MEYHMKYYLRLLSIPFTFIVIFTILFVAWELFNLPEPEKLTEIARGWFNDYGIPVLFLGSFLEGLLLVGSYFPGVLVIFLGVLVAGNPLEASVAIFVSTTGLLCAHIFNYFLGKYGWHKLLIKFGMKDAIEQSKQNLEKKGPIAITLSYWLPSVGALTNTAAGIIHMPFKMFLKYSVLSSIFWYSVVGLVVYLVGEPALSVAAGGVGYMIVYGGIVLWMLVLVTTDYKRKKYISGSNTTY